MTITVQFPIWLLVVVAVWLVLGALTVSLWFVSGLESWRVLRRRGEWPSVLLAILVWPGSLYGWFVVCRRRRRQRTGPGTVYRL